MTVKKPHALVAFMMHIYKTVQNIFSFVACWKRDFYLLSLGGNMGVMSDKQVTNSMSDHIVAVSVSGT